MTPAAALLLLGLFTLSLVAVGGLAWCFCVASGRMDRLAELHEMYGDDEAVVW